MLKRETATKLCMVFFMSCGMSLIEMIFNTRQIPTLSAWLEAWAIAFVFAFILTSFVTPLVLTKIIPSLYKNNMQNHGSMQTPETISSAVESAE
ncbi:hypothetical protein MmiEs2_12100 [Methanimicrococcus stummii]|uniref:DUF2798 domain-containing protein n=1 Tax=Methanimicrococcus stummii TaxID=3028294 RepID=A0AA96VMT7_9EURY|nr:DUF2798 domain-containing protein [Methanimicrococcus sp. Es2]WNY28997.1 hypothetical protein MmiEs2_12100 [Methanimicrococcus sp. Es2]